ncbi:MAG: hypothetical protein LRY30_00360 [Gammaproteobacteria bacterium]|nr:hypothetical protein [Gammaproteobacteria bacterium]
MKVRNKSSSLKAQKSAASLINALPDANIYITLGNITNAGELDWLTEKHHTKQLYFAADNDGAYGKSIEKIRDVAQKLHAQNKVECYFAKPHLPGKGVADKIDFNDVLLEKGLSEVKRQVSHFEKIHVQSLDIKLDEKTIDSGFNELIDEWKRLDQQYHPAFKGLAESHQRLSNDKLPQSLMASFQKTYDKHLEKIVTTPTLLKELEKIAPNVSKIINAQGSKMYGLTVDWLSPKLDNEWQALSQSNNERIKKIRSRSPYIKNNQRYDVKRS